VSALIDPNAKVEIEGEAILPWPLAGRLKST